MPIDLNDIRSGYNLAAINENFQRIEDEWDEKLDRQVSSQGNQMEQNLDMNGHRILNHAAPVGPSDLARLQDITNLADIAGAIPVLQPRQQGDGTTRTFSTPTTIATFPQSFLVFINGISQRPTTDYTITTGGQITFTTAPPSNADIDITWFEPRITENPDASQRLVTSTNSNTARSLAARFGDVVNVKDFGVIGDGVADDTAAMLAVAAFSNANVSPVVTVEFPYGSRLSVTQTIEFNEPVIIKGNGVQILQETTGIPCVRFGGTGSGNAVFKNGYNVQDMFCNNIDGSAAVYEFNNALESTFKRLYCVDGLTGFAVNGCILNTFENCFVGDGLNASPTFFRRGTQRGRANGFVMRTHNGLGSNTNVFTRCTATVCSAVSFDMRGGANNKLQSCDAEAVPLGATAVLLNNLTHVSEGNFEGVGTGFRLEDGSDGSTFKGLNNLMSFVVESGNGAINVIGGTYRFINLQAGTLNCTITGIKLGNNGGITDSGTNNIVERCVNFDGTSLGQAAQGTFSPLLRAGGSSTGVTQFQSRGRYYRDGLIVHFDCWVQLNSWGGNTGTVDINLNDLPYVPDDVFGANFGTPVTANSAGLSLTGQTLEGRLSVFPAKIVELKTLTNGVSANLQESRVSSGDSIFISGWFFAN